MLAAGLDPAAVRLQSPPDLAQLLAQRWPGHSVFLVQPSRHEAGAACYDHFLRAWTLTGEPLGYGGPGFKASEQLWSLLAAAGEDGGTNGGSAAASALPDVHAVGFSKGGVVLNQLLAEVASLQGLLEERAAAAAAGGAALAAAAPPPLPASAPLLAALRSLHYLDVGLNCRGAYLTDPQALQRVGSWCRTHPGLRLILHGTPRQWEDPHRPWIGQERARMEALCRGAGVPIAERRYFEGQPPSLLMHFRCIEEADFSAVGVP